MFHSDTTKSDPQSDLWSVQAACVGPHINPLINLVDCKRLIVPTLLWPFRKLFSASCGKHKSFEIHKANFCIDAGINDFFSAAFVMFWTFPVAQPSFLCCNVSPLYIEILLKSSVVHSPWLYWVFSNLSPQFHEKNYQESNVGSCFIISAYFVVMGWEKVYFSHIFTLSSFSKWKA